MNNNSTSTNNEALFVFANSVDQQSVKDFVINLINWSGNNAGRPLRVDINSQGGNILDGLMLFEEFARLRRQGHKLTIAVYGRAASVAGWLLQAADVRIIGANSWLLIHEVHSRMEGSLTALKQEVARCEQLQDQTYGLLVERSKLTRAQLDKETANGRDWWLSAPKVLELGLADVVEYASFSNTTTAA